MMTEKRKQSRQVEGKKRAMLGGRGGGVAHRSSRNISFRRNPRYVWKSPEPAPAVLPITLYVC